MTTTENDSVIPADDPTRQLTLVSPESPEVEFLALAGDTYAMLISGEQTAGAYCLIDMQVPDGGGPPPHRHNFEEMFTILEGQIDFTFRGKTVTAHAGTTVNIPANAPHFFHNGSGAQARMLCMCTPAGQEEYFLKVGDLVDGFDSPPPALTDEELTQRRELALELAPRYETEMLIPKS
jgi:quercetin dioxygenase-like cupin family protein